MPQAVDVYINENNLQAVDKVKRNILQLYDVDFNKIDQSGRASKIFRNIPAQLTGNAARYMISSVTDSRRSDAISTIVSEMKESMVVNIAYNTTDPNVGLGMSRDLDSYKIYLGDTGLFVTLAFWDKVFAENIIYQKLLNDKLDANLGYVYENLVAQMLRCCGHELYYHTFPSGNGNHDYEIDFLISNGNKIVPIEVKSSGYKSHKSLDVFCSKYSSRIGDRILLYTKDYKKEDAVQYIPVYFTGML